MSEELGSIAGNVSEDLDDDNDGDVDLSGVFVTLADRRWKRLRHHTYRFLKATMCSTIYLLAAAQSPKLTLST